MLQVVELVDLPLLFHSNPQLNNFSNDFGIDTTMEENKSTKKCDINFYNTI